MSATTLGSSVRASDLLNSQTKKFTMDMPADMHYRLKTIAAAHRTTVRELVIEAITSYTLQNYSNEVK